MKTTALAALLLLPFSTTASAVDYQDGMQKYVAEQVMDWVQSPVIIQAVQARNAATGVLSEEQIIAMDGTWRAEVGQAAMPTIDPVLKSAASDFLREKAKASEGHISEIFVMDAKGLNVAASTITSDYWQGDEDKFLQTFLKGPDAVHISEVELDESTQTYQAQVSFVLRDPATQTPIGAITLGLNADLF